MLGETDPQRNFFDSYIEEYFLPGEHELLEIKENVDFSFIYEDSSDSGLVFDVITIAKWDIKSGDLLDDIGRFICYLEVSK